MAWGLSAWISSRVVLQKGVQVTGQGPLWVGLALGAGVAAAKQHSWVVLRGKQRWDLLNAPTSIPFMQCLARVVCKLDVWVIKKLF